MNARFHQLQTLEDAIRYRLGRAAEPCVDCEPDRPCDDHACDLRLISAYERRARRLLTAPDRAAAISGKPGAD